VAFDANKVMVLIPADKKETVGLLNVDVAGEPPVIVHE
jgi:hypothetical protein